MENPENIFLLLLSGLNLLTNLFIVIPLFLIKADKQNSDIVFPIKNTMLYLSGTIIYSIGIWFIKDHFLIAAASILCIFSFSALIPVFTMVQVNKTPIPSDFNEMDFEKFCEKYEISKREAEIIKEICSGKSNQAIADKLFITLQTVKDHTHRIYTKTGIKNR
ncbi:MAG: helix-turn-helix transcriptional regulator, partial [Prolixibacteraceae bacterium]|nr:helix-turn-helix transcriptional regulator [Prolixibacteraceae bacterium]